jgi:hypothetical protein
MRMTFEEFWALVYYHLDFFVAEVFVLFILGMWFWAGVFQPSTWANFGYIPRWSAANYVFVIWVIPFALYLAYPFYAIWRKSKEFWFSGLHHPIILLDAFLTFYFLFFFMGGALFHKEVMFLISSLPVDKHMQLVYKEFENAIYTHLGDDFGEFVILVMIVLWYLLYLGGIWIGSTDAYRTMVRKPLPPLKKKSRVTSKAKSQAS